MALKTKMLQAKCSNKLYKAATKRAEEKEMTKSEYLRWLVERDVENK